MKLILSALSLSLLCLSCTNTTHLAKNIATQEEQSKEIMATSNIPSTSPRNIIMVIGDGMGPAYTSAYRYFIDNPKTDKIEDTVFDRHFIGSSSTYPAPISGYITDSAASATALATGIKSYNNAISVDVNKKPVETVLEWAKIQGKKTGVVVTSQINHATPASYLAHNEHRRNYNDIADSYIDDGIKADLYLGGGWKYFIREDRNLVDEFKQAGFHYIDNYQGLTNLPQNKPVLGLFADTGLPWALDDTNKHRLSTMTKAGINHLENLQTYDNSPDNGFFMLVEGSQVDWGGHARDIAAAMTEMDDLANTINYLEAYALENPDTLVIITADHSTGGLALGKTTDYTHGKIKSDYLWNPQFIRKMNMSAQAIAKKVLSDELSHNDINKLLTFDITPEEYISLTNAKVEGKLAVMNYNQLPASERTLSYPPRDYSLILTSIKHIIDDRTNTGWGSISDSASHNSVDVQVFSFGPQSEIFKGFQDNTDIAKKIFMLLGKQESNK